MDLKSVITVVSLIVLLVFVVGPSLIASQRYMDDFVFDLWPPYPSVVFSISPGLEVDA